MLQRVNANETPAAVLAAISKLREKQPQRRVLILFTGSKDKSGQSWCPDCVKADPVIHQVLDQNDDSEAAFITCEVGPREVWKKPDNPFRTHPNFRVTGVPTLLEFGTQKRLVEEACADKTKVELFFEDDD